MIHICLDAGVILTTAQSHTYRQVTGTQHYHIHAIHLYNFLNVLEALFLLHDHHLQGFLIGNVNVVSLTDLTVMAGALGIPAPQSLGGICTGGHGLSSILCGVDKGETDNVRPHVHHRAYQRRVTVG